MAQIKNIKKPGDLIRGASVGLAGLDKDGNVVGYKAAAADAGKVLTVGEDGSVTPAEGGGGGSLYNHIFSATLTGTTKSKVLFSIISTSGDFMISGGGAPLDTLFSWLSSKGFTSLANIYPATGGSASDGFVACGIYGSNNMVYIVCINQANTSTLEHVHPSTYVNEKVVEI